MIVKDEDKKSANFNQKVAIPDPINKNEESISHNSNEEENNDSKLRKNTTKGKRTSASFIIDKKIAKDVEATADDLDNNAIGRFINDFECTHFFKHGTFIIGSIAICFQG